MGAGVLMLAACVLALASPSARAADRPPTHGMALDSVAVLVAGDLLDGVELPPGRPIVLATPVPGDTLVVRIDKITPNKDWGWSGSIPNFGALAPEYKTAMITDPLPDVLYIWRMDPAKKMLTLKTPKSKVGALSVPVRPFLGTIGVAPPAKECIIALTPGAHGANMDFNEVVEGVTMSFPVFEPGALLMVGDGHAAQGDGELAGAAIETSMDVQLTVNLIKKKTIKWPRLENDRSIMSIGSTRPLMDAMRIACVDLIERLVEDYGFDKLDAYQLLGQAAELKIANVVDPQFSVACKLDKRHLPR
jgi:acetamidase/formamidase